MAKMKNKKNVGFADKIHAKKTTEKLKKKLNPFEVHINKEKFKVLGKKNKNDRGLPGVSRAKAIKKRKNTLGFELKLINKSNTFVDKRIGEKNTALTEEEKIMARFAAEKIQQHRSKASKQSIYNLADEEVLTHRGQTLEEIEKFDDPRSDDEEEDLERNKFGHLRDDFVSDVNFGGGLLSRSENSDGVKSRKDLIEQLIVESKKRKLEKQKLKEETLDLTEKLDSEWKDLHPVVSADFNKEEEKVEKTPSLIDKLLTEHEKKNEDYDKTMRMLKFEPRGTPSNRLKSEDEIAKIEKDKLEQLERDRLARMHGVTEPTNSNQKRKYKSADDLDDNYEVDSDPEIMIAYDKQGNLLAPIKSNDTKEKNQKKVKLSDESTDMNNENDKNEDSENDNDENDEDDDENNESDNDSEDSLNDLRELGASSEDDENTADEEPEEQVTNKSKNLPKKQVTFGLSKKLNEKSISGEIKPILKTSKQDNNVINGNTKTLKIAPKTNASPEKVSKSEDNPEKPNQDDLSKKEMMEKAAKELPFTYEMPQTFEELMELLESQPPEFQFIIIERIIKCNHPSLREENKKKMTNLFAYLLQYLNDVFSEENLIDENSLSTSFKIFDRLISHFYLLAQMDPANAKDSFIEVIKEKYEDFKSQSKKFPGMDTLIFFKLAAVLFSSSDLRHPAVTPCFHFLSQILSNARVKTSIDVSKGLFLVVVFLEYTSLSKRFLPSVLNFIRGVLYLSIPSNFRSDIKVIPPFKSQNTMLVMEKTFTKTFQCNKMLPKYLVTDDLDDEFKIRALTATLNILETLYERAGGYHLRRTLFENHLKILNYLPLSHYPSYIITLVNKVKNNMGDVSQTKILKPLVEENKKPKMLRLYEPSIENEFSGKKKRIMSKEKGEHQRLMYKLKKETKGALREIRRDKTYISSVKIREKIASDNLRKEKVKRIFSEASLQQGELNALQRSKKKKK